MKKKKKSENNMRKKMLLATTYLFAFIGLIASIFTIFGLSLKSNSKILEPKIIENSNVFELKNDLPSLKIIYQDKDLMEEDEGISIIKIRFENKGNISVNVNDFDIEFPLSRHRITNEKFIRRFNNKKRRKSICCSK